ncbi:MAG: GGDEF domain-containing protein, partial [Thiomicrospira sp.]
CLMLIDIDDFKRINDVYGHPAGDKVLEEVGKLLRQGLRLSDYPFRYGGEELLVLLPETRLTTAVELAEALRSLIAARSIKLESERHIAVTVSIGVAQFFDHPDYHRLIELADQKLYEAKRSGKNRVCF